MGDSDEEGAGFGVGVCAVVVQTSRSPNISAARILKVSSSGRAFLQASDSATMVRSLWLQSFMGRKD
jgi:hypothetical protein